MTQLEADLVARYGEGVRVHVATSRERVRDWTPRDVDAARERWRELDEAYSALLDAGAAADSPETLALTARHYETVCEYWTPDAAAYAGLGRHYVDDERFRARYEAVRPGLAGYLRDALEAYAAGL